MRMRTIFFCGEQRALRRDPGRSRKLREAPGCSTSTGVMQALRYSSAGVPDELRRASVMFRRNSGAAPESSGVLRSSGELRESSLELRGASGEPPGEPREAPEELRRIARGTPGELRRPPEELRGAMAELRRRSGRTPRRSSGEGEFIDFPWVF